MTKELKAKNTTIAAILPLLFGPFGYLYLGFNYFIAGISIAFVISNVLYLLHLPYPPFFNFFQLLVWSYYGHRLAVVRNVVVEEGPLTENDIKEFKSMGFAFFMMIHVMMSIVQWYAVIVVLFLVYIKFTEGKYFIAILLLVFGISVAKYLLGLIFGMISIGIMKAFKIDKKYL